MTLYQMKENLSTLKKEMGAVNDTIVKSAADPNVSVEEINKSKNRMVELKTRYDTLKSAHDDMEEAEKETLQRQFVQKKESGDASLDPVKAKAMAKGEFYKAVLNGENVKPVISKAYMHLGAIPAGEADLGYGDKLLPTTMSNELIVEPAVENPMRAIVRVSNITGLSEPKLLFDVGDDAYDDVTDKETAKEIELTGDTVQYGRHKVKVRAKIGDTVLRGSPLNLSSEIDNALRSGLSANEMNRMFSANPGTAYAGMSFYSAVNNVKRVKGATKRQAIAKALADLPLSYRRNAQIVMSALDWYDMWDGNLNSSGMFFEDRPLTLYGKKVTLVDDAIDPVVGDFNYSRINYDIGTTYDTDKDVDAGIYKFVLTAWYDIKLRLASAFRIAEVGTNP